ncbi:MAG: flagellar basal body M-ring protein FliF, partial [Rhodoferax sp.]
ILVLLGVIRPAMKTLAQPVRVTAARANQLDAVEGDQPDRPQLSAPAASNEPAQPSPGELRLEDARKLTRDNPAAVANIVKAWMNGEVPT